MPSRNTDTTDSEVTTTRDVRDLGDPTPEDLGKPVTLTGPGGTKVTVPKRAADRMKAQGYK